MVRVITFRKVTMKEPKKDFESLLNREAPPEVERMGLTWLIAAAIELAVS